MKEKLKKSELETVPELQEGLFPQELPLADLEMADAPEEAVAGGQPGPRIAVREGAGVQGEADGEPDPGAHQQHAARADPLLAGAGDARRGVLADRARRARF